MKSKRDYLRKGSHFSWLYLSRLAALKEYAFMKALGEHGLPVPQVNAGRALPGSKHIKGSHSWNLTSQCVSTFLFRV